MNEKIKEIAEFDGWVKRSTQSVDGAELYENKQYMKWLHRMPYLTDLNALHRVALDVMDRVAGVHYDLIQSALLSRPINGQYTDLVDAVYEAIVYLKKHEK